MAGGGRRGTRRVELLALLGGLSGALAQPTDLSCSPSGTAVQVIRSLLSAAGRPVPSGSTAALSLNALQFGGIVGPEVATLTRAALKAHRLPASTYLQLVVDLANGMAPSPTAARARLMLVQRGAVVPQGICVTGPDLERLLSGERTALQDSYLTPAARMAP